MQNEPISKWHTDLGTANINLFANPNRDWVPDEVRHTLPVVFGIGTHANGDQFLQIWVCPPWQIVNDISPKRSLIIIDERLASTRTYAKYLAAKAVSDANPHGYFPSNEWEYFWTWFAGPADIRLVQMSNGVEMLVLEECTGWIVEGDPTTPMLHGHLLEEASYDYSRYTIDRKANLWSWEFREEVYGYDHNLFRVTLTDDDANERITVTREDREDVYEEDPAAPADSDWPFTDKYETVWHKRTFTLELGSQYLWSEVPQSET